MITVARTDYSAVTRNSAVADASYLSSTYLQRSFFITRLVTAASDLLVHKILLNSVLLSRIVSGGVRPKPPEQTPLGFLPFVGRFRSVPRLVGRIGLGVRVNVSFQQKYPPGSVLRCPTTAENGGYDQGR